MGTRHLIAVVKDEEYKVAQYGQWDGYPDGQGSHILSFLRDEVHIEVFEEKLNHVYFISEDSLKKKWANAGSNPENSFVTLDVSERFEEIYPELSRNTGAGVLSIIHNSTRELELTDSSSFAGDSLFCEWAYVIDLDKNTFEIYKGFNKESLTEEDRFYSLQVPGEFKPVRIIKSYSLDDLPTHDTFITDLELEESA